MVKFKSFVEINDAWDYLDSLYYLLGDFDEIGMRRVNNQWQVFWRVLDEEV